MKYLSLILFIFLLFNIPVFAQTQIQDYLYKAESYALESKYIEAIDEISKAIAIESNEISLYLIRADYYRKAKNLQAFQTDIDTAISIVNKAIESDPKNAKLFLKRAYIYLFARNNSAVSEEVEKAIALNPNDFEILRESRSRLDSIGEYERSLEIADKIISLDASKPSDFYSRFLIKKNLKDFRGAIEDGIKSLELSDFETSLTALEGIYSILENEFQADENLINYYERILVILDKRAVFPYDTFRHFTDNPKLNEELNQNSKKYKREAAFDQIMRILIISIKLYQKKGMFDKADELIEQMSKYEPKDISLKIRDTMQLNQKAARLIARGDSFLAQKQYEKAMEYYQEAIKLNNSKEAHQKLFQALQMKVEAESK